MQSDRYQGRNNLANELKLHDTDKITNKPLLLEVVQRMLQGGTTAAKHSPSDTQVDIYRLNKYQGLIQTF